MNAKAAHRVACPLNVATLYFIHSLTSVLQILSEEMAAVADNLIILPLV
jgi:hypothetical protein